VTERFLDYENLKSKELSVKKQKSRKAAMENAGARFKYRHQASAEEKI